MSHFAMVKICSKSCLFASISVWIILSVFALIATSIVYLRPYIQAIRFTEAQCKVRNTFYRKQFVCACGDNCFSIYPCFMVQVSLMTSDVTQRDVIMPLFLDIEQLTSVTEAKAIQREMVSSTIMHTVASRLVYIDNN